MLLPSLLTAVLLTAEPGADMGAKRFELDTPAKVDAAIAFGAAADAMTFVAFRFGTTIPKVDPELLLGPDVILDTPFTRVATLAWDAKRKYVPLSATDLHPGVLEPKVSVSVRPLTHGEKTMTARVENIDHVVVIPKDGQPIQPSKIERAVVTVSNLMGAERELYGQDAEFPLSVLAHGNEIRIVMSSGREASLAITEDLLNKLR